MNNEANNLNLPAVSVIVPVYNDEHRIKTLLEALLAQNYPEDRYEILIVDNNSTDRTPEIIQQYPVHFLQEKEYQSSYAARNRGIRQASYDLLAFTDSDCRPDPQWLAEGVKTLLQEPADLAAGQILFTYVKYSAAEIYDSINHLQNKRDIQQHQSAPTANLFVRRKVVERIGEFPVVESGGDLTWTLRAVRNGFHLVYAEKAVIYHPARLLKELLKKMKRTGRGSFAHWKQSIGARRAWLRILRLLLPRRACNVRKAIRECGQEWMEKQFWRIWLVAYLCNLTSFVGILEGMCRKNKEA